MVLRAETVLINDRMILDDLGLVSETADAAAESISELKDTVDANTEQLDTLLGGNGVIEIVPSVPYIALRVIDVNGNATSGRLRITNNRIELLDSDGVTRVTWIQAGEMSSGAINFTELNPRYFNGDEMVGTLKWIARSNGHLTLKNINKIIE